GAARRRPGGGGRSGAGREDAARDEDRAVAAAGRPAALRLPPGVGRYFDFVSPFFARVLLTVRAAISFARFVERPCFFSLSLMCSYCRSRLSDHVLGM